MSDELWLLMSSTSMLTTDTLTIPSDISAYQVGTSKFSGSDKSDGFSGLPGSSVIQSKTGKIRANSKVSAAKK